MVYNLHTLSLSVSWGDDGLKDGSSPGGGHSQYILVGVCRGTSKKGGLRHGTTQKRGVLDTGTTQKKGGLKNWSCKKDNLSN